MQQIFHNSKSRTESVYLTLICLLLVALPLCIYWQVTQFEFLNLDDNRYILDNPFMYEGLTWTSIKWAWSTFSDPYYMPLTRLSYLLDVSIYGINEKGFHFTNLVFHIINSLLLFYFIRILTKKLLLSAIISILFAIHPQHAEAVIWIAQRKELLGATFGLLSLICYVCYVNEKVFPLSNYILSPNLFYLMAVLAFLLSLLSKPTWITLPALLILMDWWPLQLFKNKSAKSLLINKIPFIFLASLILIMHLITAGTDAEYVIISPQTLPLEQRIVNAFVIYMTYFGKTFSPVNLGGYLPYPMYRLPVWEIIVAGMLLLIISFSVFNKYASRPYLAFGWLWFLIALLPMLGIVSKGEWIFTGDRWTYLPHIGLFIAIAWLIESFPALLGRYKTYFAIVAVSIISVLSLLTWDLGKHWQNSETYWFRTLELTRDNHYAHRKLGAYYNDTGRTDKAIEHYLSARKINPTEPYYVLELGNIYLTKGNIEQAWKYYEKLLTITATPIDLLTKMGIMAIYNNAYYQAEKFFKAALNKPPVNKRERDYYYSSHLYMGLLLSVTGNTKQAVQNIEEFLRNPSETREANCYSGLTKLLELRMKKGADQSIKILSDLCG